MIHLLGKVPNNFYLAVSGGIDSMVALDFFLNGRYKPTVLYFNHGTTFGDKAEDFVKSRCKDLNLSLIINKIKRDPYKNESIEEYWRNERYSFFNKISGPIITAHHLDDVAEWWLFSCMHGLPKLIPYKRNNVIRPFLMTAKSEIISWAKRRSVQYMDDPSNKDEKYMRTIIRSKILPEALKVNPGLRTVLKKKIKEENKIS